MSFRCLDWLLDEGLSLVPSLRIYYVNSSLPKNLNTWGFSTIYYFVFCIVAEDFGGDAG